jgi:uncharacterized HAD superfamily protein
VKIQIDVDGVLADFMLSACKLAQHFDPTIPLVDNAHTKDWDNWEGWSREVKSKVWKEIKTLPYFFCDLTPLVTREEIRMLRSLRKPTNEIYFVTSRPGPTAKWQTEQWIWDHMEFVPTVVITEKKAEFAKLIKPDWSIEDHAKNAHEIGEVIGPNRSYIIDRLYNQKFITTTGYTRSPDATRVKTLKEFFNDIMG